MSPKVLSGVLIATGLISLAICLYLASTLTSDDTRTTVSTTEERTAATPIAGAPPPAVAATPPLTKTTQVTTKTTSPLVALKTEIIKIVATGITVGIVGAYLKTQLDDLLKQREAQRQAAATQELERQKGIAEFRNEMALLQQSCRSAIDKLRARDYVTVPALGDLFTIQVDDKPQSYWQLLNAWEDSETPEAGGGGLVRKGPVVDARKTYEFYEQLFSQKQGNATWRATFASEITTWSGYFRNRQLAVDPYDYGLVVPPASWRNVLETRLPRSSRGGDWKRVLYSEASADVPSADADAALRAAAQQRFDEVLSRVQRMAYGPTETVTPIDTDEHREE